MKLIYDLKRKLSNEYTRLHFVEQQLRALPKNSLILDAGCGSQQYRKFCTHLQYRAQDFGQYTSDSTVGFTSKLGGDEGYKYGELDYTGNIWSIDEKSQTFDAILCTEVLEHIPYPNETISELSRLLKPNGVLILTLPSNCLRHMDPYFYYSGFSNNYLTKMLNSNELDIISMDSIGDYYSWMAVELARTMKSHSLITALLLAPAFFWYYKKKPTVESKNTLCMGYHVVARKNS